MIGVIPAMGRSNRISRKNTKVVGGKPMIQWTFEAVKGSQMLTEVYVSTEDAQIRALAADFGLKVLDRPANLAQPETTGDQVLLHCLQQQIKPQPTAVCFLQPTSPLRTSEDIDEAIELFNKSGAPCVISVVRDSTYFLTMKQNPGDSTIKSLHPAENLMNSQFWTQDRFTLNGAIYVAKTAEFIQQKVLCNMDGIVPFEMPQSRSLDVDTLFDVKIADMLLS